MTERLRTAGGILMVALWLVWAADARAALNAEKDSSSEVSAAPDKEPAGEAKAASESVEINGDSVEFMMKGNKMIATGNVVIIKGDTKLTCDRVEFSKETSIASAQGHVRLSSPQTSITGESMTFDFAHMTGEFMGARIASAPFYGYSKSMAKVEENHIEMRDGYLTTCDHDKPHFRFASRKLDVYPGEKMVARNMKLLVGPVPLMYIPRFTQRLDGRPRFTFTPGFSKEWGMFVLSQYRFELNPNLKGKLLLDYRHRLGVGEGVSLEYNSPKTGSGIVRTYYTDDWRSAPEYLWEEPEATTHEERYKVEWRHKWDINDRTQAVWQYYRLSGPTFLKDYFENDYEREANPATYFLLSRVLPNGSLSFRTDVRVNTFVSSLERLPEIRYDITNQRLGASNFYLRSTNTYSNLVLKDASPTEVNKETERVDTVNELSYPMRVSIFELKPLVGGRQTYYSRTKEPSRYDIVRSLFTTGADLSTKFYKIYDVKSRFWGIAVNRLRHIVTPSVAYRYSPDPTAPSSLFDQFDSTDSVTGDHTLSFSLENKFQTKRNGENVDLLRVVFNAPFRLKEFPGDEGFDNLTSVIDFKPVNWLTLSADSSYDALHDHINAINFDLYVNDIDDRWYWFVSKRLNRDVDDQLTTELGYKINPKWKFSIFERLDVEHGLYKEHHYKLTRDLHEWEMDLQFGEKRNEGAEILLIFRLKAFPDAAIDIGTSFNKRKAGSQSSTGN